MPAQHQTRTSLKKWEGFHKALIEAATPEAGENWEQQQKRIAGLEANHEAWFGYYFPKYANSNPAPFHRRASKRFIQNKRWYEVRSWSRGFAKSTRTMFEVLYLALTGKAKNILLVSYSYDNAERLLMPYMINLERNKRILHDYGYQVTPGKWISGEFTTTSGASFTAVGAGQSPRGAKKEEKRPDVILIDDIDTDEETRNEKRIQDKWEWIEQALIPTLDISADMRILFCGNIIAKDCCITRAQQHADKVDIVNLVNAKGQSNWPAKFKQEDVEYIRSKISYISFQKEYMNNPLSVGSVFEDITYNKMQQLRHYRMLVCYTDPSFKESKKNDYKATVLVGLWKGEFHIIKAFVEQTTTAQMVQWHYDIMDMLGGLPCYYYMEANLIQDILMEEFHKVGKVVGKMVPIKGDERKKPDKFTRIESLLEPLNRAGKLIFNEREKENPHMQRLDEQFKAFQPGSRAHDDGPDAVEGAVWIINNKVRELTPPVYIKRNPLSNTKRF
jgi:predicted phage terminase large subunit-like protein